MRSRTPYEPPSAGSSPSAVFTAATGSYGGPVAEHTPAMMLVAARGPHRQPALVLLARPGRTCHRFRTGTPLEGLVSPAQGF
ncbi:hypothetical protein ACFLIM_23520 [Nonomuraea sp. M3C6]|uniref:Uncharacterized protein n=1 Tax=Nonomuraea marmarensis TaxID=3351344 RepID=A0ABW7AFR7_9ACTN